MSDEQLDAWKKEAARLNDRIKELEAQLEEMNKNCISLLLHESRMSELKTQNDKLRKALEVYANEKYWTTATSTPPWEIARKALGDEK